MTDIQKEPTSSVLRRDTQGRVQTPPELREQILDEFEKSGLSAPKFAELHGINYQTFASWRKRRKDNLSKKGLPKAGQSGQVFTFLEVTPGQPLISEGQAEGLIVDLKGGHRVTICNDAQICQLAKLIGQINLISNHESC
jgi:hypothetical protein